MIHIYLSFSWILLLCFNKYRRHKENAFFQGEQIHSCPLGPHWGSFSFDLTEPHATVPYFLQLRKTFWCPEFEKDGV
jgi:hypothetical protein